MRVRRCCLIAALIALEAVSASAQSAALGPPHPADIRRLESALVEALQARDRQRLEPLLAADFVLRGAPDIDRETWLQNVVKLCWGERSELDGFRTLLHDHVVIAWFELTFHVDPGPCGAGVLRYLITDVWVREAGEWKLKVRHARAPAASADIVARYGAAAGPVPVWEASSELSAVATAGNTSTRTVGLGAQVVRRAAGQKTEVNTRFLTSRADDVTTARSLTVEGRHGFPVTQRLQTFGQASYARDRFAGIDDRVTAAAGLAYTVSVPSSQSLTLEGGLGWTSEQRLDLATLRFATATGALDYTWTILPGTELREEAAVYADLESARNWRTSNTTTLSVGLTRVLSLRASHAIEYRRTPVVGFGRSDMRTAAALVFSLARRPPAR